EVFSRINREAPGVSLEWVNLGPDLYTSVADEQIDLALLVAVSATTTAAAATMEPRETFDPADITLRPAKQLVVTPTSFDGIVAAMPDGVKLSSCTIESDLTIDGFALTSAQIEAFADGLRELPQLSVVRVDWTTEVADGPERQFRIVGISAGTDTDAMEREADESEAGS
ncbi:MAG: PilN domain-containing protein, partial [Planctomycetota bacterium]